MARKKKSVTKRRKPIRSPADSAAGRLNVLLEDIQTKLRVLAEGQTEIRESLPRKIAEGVEELKVEVSVLRISVAGHTEQLKKLESKFDGLESKFDGLESKFGGLESKFGGLESKFDGLDGRLRVVEGDMGGIHGQLASINEKLDTALALEGRVAALEAKAG